ncbi:hypothetical protein ACKWTF_013605 [Chironomus riparius]
MNRLGKIVHKIANYVPWQSEGLTEDEFKVLDRANGVELAEIAYNNRINFNRFLKNADLMIDAYNENLVWTQIKEVRALKRCLLNPGSFTVQKVPVGAEKEKQVTVRTVQNDDNVVPQMELPQNSPENIRHCIEEAPERLIENELAQTVPNTRTFVSSLLADNSGLSKSISMHRNVIRETGNITLQQQNPIPNVDSSLDNDEMPILDEMEMAKMGVFDGLAGKRISRVLHQRERAHPIPNLSVDAESAPRNVQPLEIDINPLSVENMDNLLFTPNTDSYDVPDLSPLHANQEQIQQPIINDQQQSQVIVEQINPENVQIPNLNAEQAQEEIENATNGRDSMAERADSFRNAVEAFETLLGRARRVIRKGKNLQNRQRQPQMEEELVMLKLRREVTFKTKKTKHARKIKQNKLVIVDLDFFGDIEVYISNDMPFDEAQLEVEVPQRRESDFNIEFNPVTSHHRVATSTPMNSAQKNKRLISSPEQLDQQAKRTRLETLDDVRNYLIDLPNPTESMAPIPEVPQELTDVEVPALNQSNSAQQPVQLTSLSVPHIPSIEPSLPIHPIQQDHFEPPIIEPELPQLDIFEPPAPIQRELLPAVPEIPELEMESSPLPLAESSREQTIPQMRRQSRLEILQNLHVTPDSIDYDRLRRNSKLRKTPIDSRIQILPEEIFQNACENISEREAAKMRNALGNKAHEPLLNPPEIPQTSTPAPKPVKDKFGGLPRVMMNGELYVELKSRDGSKKIYYTEHQLSCLTLYFKIRFLMRKLKGTNQPWRMTIKELFSQLKDLKESKLVTYQQLKHMTQIKLFEAKWSDDDLLEIEIPIDLIDETSDKENTPSVRQVSLRQPLGKLL